MQQHRAPAPRQKPASRVATFALFLTGCAGAVSGAMIGDMGIFAGGILTARECIVWLR